MVAAGELVRRLVARGNDVDWSYVGLDGKPVMRTDGYARMTLEYDGNGNRTKTTYLGTNALRALVWRKHGLRHAQVRPAGR